MFRTIHWEIKNSIAWLILQQPPSNRMDRLFFEEIKELVTGVIPGAEFNALIICGAGRHFSSGADIDDLLSGIREARNNEQEVPAFLRENNRHFLFFKELNVPVIAAIQGVCFGSALELAMFCHFRICGDGVLLSLPEVSFNLMPGCGGTQNVSKLMSRGSAIQYLLEGRNLDAAEALSAGLVDQVVPRKTLFETCENLAVSLAPDYDKRLRDHYLRRILNPMTHERIS